jgi:succinate dehydrogenase / fumarate reductase flavoprotein subunit
MLAISEVCARAAKERTESRGGHTRSDHPKTDPAWGIVNIVVRRRDGRLSLGREPLSQPPAELSALLADEAAHARVQPDLVEAGPS